MSYSTSITLRFLGDNDDSVFTKLIEQALEMYPPNMLSINSEMFSVDGARWPKWLEFNKFIKLYKNRGTLNMKGFSSCTGNKAHDYSLRWRRRDNEESPGYLEIYIPQVLETLDLSSKLVVIKCLSMSYGGVARAYANPRNILHPEFTFVCWESEPNIGISMRWYKSLYRIWFLALPWSTQPPAWTWLELIHPANIITDHHLDLPLKSLKTTLRQWIAQDSSRGELQSHPHGNYVWHVPNECIWPVTQALWKTELFPMHKYFNLTGFYEPLLVPTFAVRPAALEFKITNYNENIPWDPRELPPRDEIHPAARAKYGL
jgi:hypothetical protein